MVLSIDEEGWSDGRAHTILVVARPIICISFFLLRLPLSLSFSLSLFSCFGSCCCLTSFGCHTNQRMRERHAIMGCAKLFPSFFSRVIVFHDLIYFIFLQFFDVFLVMFFVFLPCLSLSPSPSRSFTNPLLTLVFFKSSNVNAYAVWWMSLSAACNICNLLNFFHRVEWWEHFFFSSFWWCRCLVAWKWKLEMTGQ